VSEPMTDDDLEMLERLCALPDDGEWDYGDHIDDTYSIVGWSQKLGFYDVLSGEWAVDNAHFIAKVHDEFPKLVAEVRRLHVENQKLRCLLGKTAQEMLDNLERYGEEEVSGD